MIAHTLSDLIVHVERCVIASGTRGDFDYCIATWLRVGALYDLNLRLIRRYRNKLPNIAPIEKGRYERRAAQSEAVADWGVQRQCGEADQLPI